MRLIFLILTFFVLFSCGGGGGDTQSSSSPLPSAPVSDVTPPKIPTQTITQNVDGTLNITGMAEANATVTVTFPDGTSGRIDAAQSGEYGPVESSLPQPNGQVTVSATDASGNTSQVASSDYNDNTAPQSATQSFSVNNNGTLSVQGQAEALSSVELTFPDGEMVDIITDSQKQFGPVLSSLPQTNGIIGVRVVDINGNVSETDEEVYIDTTAPLEPSVFITINDDKTISVSGFAEAFTLINVTFDDATSASIQTSEEGIFDSLTSEESQFSGQVLVTATDLAGNSSTPVSLAYNVPYDSNLWELENNEQAQDIVRFLTQATFGPTEEDIQRLVSNNAAYDDWIEQQIAVPQTNLVVKFENRARESGVSVNTRTNLDQAYHKQLIASDMLWDTFANGEDQLRQRVAFALSQIFVVSEVSDTLFNNSKGVVAYHDMLAKHALGNYRDLMEEVTLSPIMGEYLSMIRNEKANAAQNIRPDENYARELMQLFSIGLVMLNSDGSIQTDSQGLPIPSYDQEIVKAFSRVFTGWTYSNASFWNFDGWLFGNMLENMKPFEEFHDTDEKQLLLGESLPAGQTAYQNLQGALDNLFYHQNLPPFISKQLIQRLVTSNPSPQYVSRISAVFSDNGEGVRGDLAAVVKAILLDEEARNGHTQHPNTFGKVKEPVLKFTALIRGFGVTAQHPVNASGSLRPTLRYFWPGAASGQRPYGSPSVFNFFRPEHSPSGPIREAGLVAPELQILDENYITNATNYGSATIFNSYDFLLSGCHERRQYLDGFGCPYPDFSREIQLAQITERLLSRLNLLMLAGKMSDTTRQALAVLAEQQTEDRFVVAEVVHLLYISPEFAVQR